MKKNPDQTLDFNRQTLKRLKRAFRKAEEAGEPRFQFDGCDLMTGYAKYLIEFVDGQLGDSK